MEASRAAFQNSPNMAKRSRILEGLRHASASITNQPFKRSVLQGQGCGLRSASPSMTLRYA